MKKKKKTIEQESVNEVPVTDYSQDTYYKTPDQDMINYTQTYSQNQNVYSGSDFYPPYYPQQANTMMPFNYAAPMMYMAPQNVVEPTIINSGYPNMGYHEESTTYPGYENISYGGSDKDYYSNQNYGSYYNDGYDMGNEKPYYYARDRPRYDVKPKLPPRFQKKKRKYVSK